MKGIILKSEGQGENQILYLTALPLWNKDYYDYYACLSGQADIPTVAGKMAQHRGTVGAVIDTVRIRETARNHCRLINIIEIPGNLGH